MLTETQLKLLASAMTETVGATHRVDAGYTYLGQFLSHEIVRPTRPPAGTTRFASPRLDMDSVYGTPQQMNDYLKNGMFPLPPADPREPDDLPRDQHGLALIPEPRNDDNVIIAQLHRFWQRFHNYLLLERLAADALQARQLVTKVVQLLVVEDYLRQLLAPIVFDSYFRFDRRWVKFGNAIPPHFSHAAFRFGHSMVRSSYDGFGERAVQLHEIFRSKRKLEREFVVRWDGFFGAPVAENQVQDAMRIDPFIARGMLQIPGIGAPEITNIIERNLQAGYEARLPDGKAYVQELLAEPNGAALASAFALGPLPDLGVLAPLVPADSGISIDNLPLWPYVLIEAMHASNGKHLGVLGSLICAEVFGRAIRKAPDSIYDGKWRSVDDVLERLGPLGERLQARRRSGSNGRVTERNFCMHHVLSLVLNSN
jgi:hypothetical protein